MQDFIKLSKFSLRLQIAIGEQSISGFSKTCGLRYTTITNILKRGTIPSADKASVLADGAKVNLEWLVTGRGPMCPNDPQSLKEPSSSTISLTQLKKLEASTHSLIRVVYDAGGDPIPKDLYPVLMQENSVKDKANTYLEQCADLDSVRYVDVIEVETATGHGAYVEDEIVKGRVFFKNTWLNENGLQAGHCKVISVHGESMEPGIADGSSILVNLASCNPRHNAIFVVQTEDGLIVKRLMKAKTRWMLDSDNPAWKSTPLPENAKIIGEVKWTARTLK